MPPNRRSKKGPVNQVLPPAPTRGGRRRQVPARLRSSPTPLGPNPQTPLQGARRPHESPPPNPPNPPSSPPVGARLPAPPLFPPLDARPRPPPVPRRPSARDDHTPVFTMKTPKIPGNTREGKAERVLWRAHLERSKEAAARARARRDREDEEWEAEVNQFGEPEARRRRLEEIEVNKELDKLIISSIEEDEAEDLVSDPMLTVHARLRVNGRVIWTSSLGSKKRSVFSIWDFEQTLETEIEKRSGHTKGWTTTSIVVIIKAIHSRARNVHQTIDNYTETEWEKVLIVIDDESRKWKPDITIKIEISMEEPKQSNPPDILLDATESSTIITTPTGRRTRTHQLLERQRDQGEILINAGEFDRQLVNRWVCHAARCTNQNNFCFVDEDGLHYDLSHTLQRDWAKALARGDISASLDNPLPTLYRFILRQGRWVSILGRREYRKDGRIPEKIAMRRKASWVK